MNESGRKKKQSGQNKSYYYALTYDDEDTESVGEASAGGDDDISLSIQKRVATILAETEIVGTNAFGDPQDLPETRLDMNDNLFDRNGSLRNMRSLNLDMSDDDFQSAESRSDREGQEPEVASVDEDFVQITRPSAEQKMADEVTTPDRVRRSSGSTSDQSPTTTSGSMKRPGKTENNPLTVVYVKQKPVNELYDGNFIDDDILQPQEDKIITDNMSQDLLPLPIDEMTLEMDEEDDGTPEAGSAYAVDADPIIFRKSSTERWFVRHRKAVIAVAVVLSLAVAGGVAGLIFLAIQSMG